MKDDDDKKKGHIIRSLDQLGPAMASTGSIHAEFIRLAAKMEHIPIGNRSGGICGQADYRLTADPETLNNLSARLNKKLPDRLARLRKKIQWIADGKDHMDFRRRVHRPEAPMDTEQALEVLFASLMVDVQIISTSRLLACSAPSSEERLTVDLVRAMIAKYPHLDGGGNA